MANTGILHWGEKVKVASDMGSWYDTTVYRVKVSGAIDIHKIATMLKEKRYPPTHNVFGGYCSLGSVQEDLDNPGHVRVEVVYHIGE